MTAPPVAASILQQEVLFFTVRFEGDCPFPPGGVALFGASQPLKRREELIHSVERNGHAIDDDRAAANIRPIFTSHIEQQLLRIF